MIRWFEYEQYVLKMTSDCATSKFTGWVRGLGVLFEDEQFVCGHEQESDPPEVHCERTKDRDAGCEPTLFASAQQYHNGGER